MSSAVPGALVYHIFRRQWTSPCNSPSDSQFDVYSTSVNDSDMIATSIISSSGCPGVQYQVWASTGNAITQNSNTVFYLTQ